MIEILNDCPSNVAGFRASGEVKKEDYQNVVIPVIDALAKQIGKINFLLLLDTDVNNYTADALASDIKAGFKHFTQWHKMAYVTDQEGMVKFADALSFISPGEVKGFKKSELEQAKAWVAG